MSDDSAANEVLPVYLREGRVQHALALAEHVMRWNESRLFGLVLHAPEPDHMAAVAFGVVHEHQQSTTLLVQRGLLGSATALMRPAFEAFVRGLWLQWATDDELARFQRGHDTATPDKIIRRVVKRSGAHRYMDLLDTWQQSEKTMHGYVHHGYQSLIRRSGVIETQASEVADLLGFITSMALHASLEILELAEKRVPESEVATRPRQVAELQLEVVGMLQMMGLAQVRVEESPTAPTAIDMPTTSS